MMSGGEQVSLLAKPNTADRSTGKATTTRRQIRVVYVAPTTAAGGSARSLAFLIENLPRGSVSATLVAPRGAYVDVFRRSGVRVIAVPSISTLLSRAGAPLDGIRRLILLRTLWDLRSGPAIAAALRRERPDLVHINDLGIFQPAWIAKRMGIPVVMHARAVLERRSRVVTAIMARLANRYVDRVLPIDESVRNSIPEIERFSVVYNPCPLGPGVSPAAKKPGQPTRVIFISGLLENKGVWDLLEAAKLLRGRADIVFDVYGGNSRPEGFYRTLSGRVSGALGLAPDMERAAREWVKREGLEGTLRLLGHVEATSSMFGETDILVFPSHLNGPGRPVFEAGVHGVPSIVTMRDRVEDVVVDGETGIITPERDPAALAHAIVQLADDPERRRRLGLNARRKYREQFDAERIGEQVLSIYKEVIAEKDAARAMAQGVHV